MERLTRRLRGDGKADCHYCNGEYMTRRGCSMRCPTRAEQLERLAAYEDTNLTPEQITALQAELAEYRQADALQGGTTP